MSAGEAWVPGPVKVTRAICWLPARECWSTYENTRQDGAWSWAERTHRILGRIGYRVTTEVVPVQAAAVERTGS